MHDTHKTKAQLTEELAALRYRVVELEAVGSERKQRRELLDTVVEGTTGAVGQAFFSALVRHLADALQVRFAFVSELDDVEGKRVRLLALWTGTGYGENFAYDTTGTPCEHVVGQSLAYYPTGVQQRFPDDLWLQQANIESYLAIPLFGAAGQALGHLGVMHDGPMDDRLPAEAILRIFAARAGAELERTGAEEALQQAHDELERRVVERTAALQHTNERLQAEIIGRQRVEQEILDSEERFSRFMDNLPGVAFIKDADGRHVFISKRFENILHLSHNAWYGKTNEDLFPTDVARRFTENDQLVLTQGSVLETEEEMMTQDGTKSSWLVHKFPIRGKDDAAFMLGGIAIDITERKRWEEALQESEAQLTLIMDNVPILIAYVDKELRYRFVNRTFERWHGRSATDIVGVHLSDIRSERAYHQLRQYAETALSGQQLATETSMPNRHGGSRDVHATYVPNVDQQGNVQGYFAFVHDITERKQTEGRLRDVSGRLINAQEAERSRIARELHDDVNQKLALLAIDLELVGQTPADSSVQITEHIQRLSQQVKDLSSAVHDLSHRLHPSTLERLGLVTAVESLCKELSGQHGIQIAFAHKDIPTSLPDESCRGSSTS